MKIVVFGANGGTGKNIVERALADGHEVIAVARRPETVANRERLTVRKGDVLDPDGVLAVLAGADAVICAIGPTKNRSPGTLISSGVKNIVDGCQAAGVRRFVLESGMIASDGAELSWLGRMATRIFGWIYPKLRVDKLQAESTLSKSALDWVIVRPPGLNHAKGTGNYIAGPHARIVPAKTISHADAAEVLIKATSEPAWVKQIINVGRA